MQERKYHVVMTSSDYKYREHANNIGLPFVDKNDGPDRIIDKLEEIVGKDDSLFSSCL